MITYLVRNGNMLFRVSEINIKYAQEKPSEKKKRAFSYHTIGKSLLTSLFTVKFFAQ